MQKKMVPVLLAGFLIPSLCAAAEERAENSFAKIRSLYRDARSLRMKKEYARANELLTQVLGLLPRPKESPVDANFAQVHYDVACNYALLGKKDEALESLGRAVESGLWNADLLSRAEPLKDLREEKEFTALVEKARRAVGEMAFGLKDLQGKELLKKDYAGKVLVIDVWGTWCPPCRMEIPHFVKLQKEYGKDGLAILGLTYERTVPDERIKKRVESFATQTGINYPLVLVTPGFVNSIPGVSAFPTTFFVGRDGLVADRVTGAMDYYSLEAKILPLLKAKKPESVQSGDPAGSEGS